MRKNKFFKIVFPSGKSIAVVSETGWAGLAYLTDAVENKENTYISPISWFEFVRYVMSKV